MKSNVTESPLHFGTAVRHMFGELATSTTARGRASPATGLRDAQQAAEGLVAQLVNTTTVDLTQVFKAIGSTRLQTARVWNTDHVAS